MSLRAVAPALLAGVVAVILAVAASATPAGAPSASAPNVGASDGLTEWGRTHVDWDNLDEGDRVPLRALAPATIAAGPAMAVQKRALAGVDRVSIPALSAVIPIVESDGSIPSIEQVAWMRGTSVPGSRSGVAVLAGHLTTGPKGADAGPLWGAERLPRGSLITVTWRGKATTYRVTRVTKNARGDFPSRLFAHNTRPGQLGLITCTGPYRWNDKRGAPYLSRNAVIWATRVR